MQWCGVAGVLNSRYDVRRERLIDVTTHHSISSANRFDLPNGGSDNRATHRPDYWDEPSAVGVVLSPCDMRECAAAVELAAGDDMVVFVL